MTLGQRRWRPVDEDRVDVLKKHSPISDGLRPYVLLFPKETLI